MGDKENAGAYFDAVVAPLAAELGLPFTYAENKAFCLEGHELDDAELAAVAGGSAFCYAIGGSSDVSAREHDGDGGYACAYIGVTVAIFFDD